MRRPIGFEDLQIDVERHRRGHVERKRETDTVIDERLCECAHVGESI
jgi:hypothetical protein